MKIDMAISRKKWKLLTFLQKKRENDCTSSTDSHIKKKNEGKESEDEEERGGVVGGREIYVHGKGISSTTQT